MKRAPKRRIDYTDWTEEQHAEHLRTHETYLAYYEQFNPKSVEEFIKNYATKKFDIFEAKDINQRSYERHQTQFLSLADAFIDMILQKKLFNLQCQWRARLIELPLVDTYRDFAFWEKHIRHCPFIPPITQEEIDLCARFLKEEIDFSDLMDDNPNSSTWQNYEAFKNQLQIDENEQRIKDGDIPIELPSHLDHEDMPDLYEFFDEHQNTEGLFNLPDLRREIEEKYYSAGYHLAYNQRVEQLKAEGTWKESVPRSPTDDRPSLRYYGDYLAKFIETIEDEETKDIFKYHEYAERTARRSMYDEDEMDEYISFLKEFEEDIPVKADKSWKGAIIIAVREFKQKKAAEMLSYAYDTYLLEFDEDKTVEQIIAERVSRIEFNPKDYFYQKLMEDKETILNGREAIDGVRDFNY